jgi:hypothetical protein
MLPCRDWQSVLRQQCDWLHGLKKQVLEQYEQVLSISLQCREYPPPGEWVGQVG